MQSIYKKYFSVKVTHTYYKLLTSKDDVLFTPTRECRELMEANRMLYRKNVDGRISVLYRTAGESTSTPFISFDTSKYVFAIGARDKAKFLNMTNLDSGSKPYAAGKLLYFRNNGMQQALSHELLDSLRPAMFTYEFTFAAVSGAVNTGDLTITNENDAEVFHQAEITRDANGIYKQPLDLRDLPKGKYTFSYKDSTHLVATEETVYIDTDLAGKDIIGVMEISSVNASAPLFTGPEFKLEFTRQYTLWRYYVVLKSGKVLPSDTIEIVDLAYDDTNSSYSEYTFSFDGTATVGGLPATRFISDEVIPFFEEPKTNLKLRKTTSGITTLIQSLPNPSSNTIAELIDTGHIGVSEIFVYV